MEIEQLNKLWQSVRKRPLRTAIYVSVVGILAMLGMLATGYFGEKGRQAASQSDVRERPYVFFKMTKLLKPLAIGESPIVEFILANSGQMEANGAIRDITYFFDVDPRKQLFEYQTSEPVSFSLAPTTEWNGQIRLSFVLTKEKIDAIREGRARLFFFARGEYKDSLDRSYPLPLCRIYDKDMLGNLIMCPDQMTIKQKE